MDSKTRTFLGGALLVVSTLIILAVGPENPVVPAPLAGVAALVMAAGVLLVGLPDGTGV
jgi:hypothetical protein